MRSQPRVLLVTTRRWFSAARLALALTKAGFEVEVICPSNHPIRLITAVHERYLFHSLWPLSSFKKGIACSDPDLVIPGDDLAAIYLRSLHRSAVRAGSADSRSLRNLIERSLGDPSSYPAFESRAKFIKILANEGILAPETSSVGDRRDLMVWSEQHGFPAVLKADGTWSGEGVLVVTNLAEAKDAFRRLCAPASAMSVLKQVCLEHDYSLLIPWLQRTKLSVSIQRFVAGSESNIAVSCASGEVLASISAEVLHTWSKHGPSSILRILPDGEMLRMAKIVAKTFGLSGLFGLDFSMDAETGQPLLLEINPRATQTCHLPLGPDHDLPSALFAALTGRDAQAVCAITRPEIALFPLAWQGNSPSLALKTAHHDIPWEEPSLVRAGETEIQNAALTRLGRLWVKTRLFTFHPEARLVGIKSVGMK